MQRINLKRLRRIRPTINLSPETKELFTWKELRAPLSVTFAALFGMVTAMLLEYYYPKSPIPIKTAAVISTTLLIMGEMGTSEKFYLKTTLRVLGVFLGICLGMVYAICEKSLEDYLEIDNSTTAARQPGASGSPHEWIMIIFRVGIITPTVFLCCMGMKIFPKYAYAINVMAIHCPTALLAKTIYASLGITIAALMAVVAAVLSLVLFDKFTTESLLMETNRLCIHGVLSVFQLAVTGEAENLNQFLTHTDAVHKSISSAESAHEVYVQWRAWTCRSVVHDFKALVKPTRPLFYQAYSLFWSNVAAYHAGEYRAEILFCNDAALYEKHFKSLIDDTVIAIDNIKVAITKLYRDPSMREDEMDLVFDDIIGGYLWHGLLRAQEELKIRYMRNRKEAFSTFGQRWNMTDYLRQIAMMTLALVEYVRAMVDVFQKPERRMRLSRLLDELAEGLDLLRREEDVIGMKSKFSTQYEAWNNKTIHGVQSLLRLEEATTLLHKSSSSPNLLVPGPVVAGAGSLATAADTVDDITETSSLIPRGSGGSPSSQG